MSNLIILVPLDGSKQALSALPVAKVLGEIERATLHILHVGEHELTAEELRSRLGREAPMLDDFTIDARVGMPAVQILQVAEEMKPRAIVMCKHSGTERGKMPGRTAMKVLHDARCPVVMVPPERGAAPWHLHHVLVPHDGTPSTSAALQPAAELAERGRAELSGGPRNGHQDCSGGGWLSHHTTLCRSATARMARLDQRVFKPSRMHLPARPFARADIPRPWRYRRGNPALVQKAIHGPHRPRLERNMGSPSRGDPEGHSARGALSHNGGAHLKSERHRARKDAR